MKIKKTHEYHDKSTPYQAFNGWVARKITNLVGTMTCAYAFAALALISLPAAILTHSLIVIVAWIAQTFLQLVLLSVILVGQGLQSTAADDRAEKTYKDTEEIKASLQIQNQILNDFLKKAEH